MATEDTLFVCKECPKSKVSNFGSGEDAEWFCFKQKGKSASFKRCALKWAEREGGGMEQALIQSSAATLGFKI